MHPTIFLRPWPAVRSCLLALSATLALVGCGNAPYPAEKERSKVRIVGGANITSFDPTVSYNAGDGPLIALVYPSFYRYKWLKRNPYELELNFGAAMPTVEKLKPAKPGDAAERWTYRFRKDLRFQDDPCFPGGKGRAVTAADVLYSFKRMIDPVNECPIASYLADKVVGWDADSKRFETAKAKAYEAPLAGVRVDPKDPYALQIDLNQPYPQLNYLMAMAFTTPQASEAMAKYGKDDYGLHHPVGSGTFMMRDYVANDHIDLVRNPAAPIERYPTEADPNLTHLLGDAGKRVPFIDEVYLPIMTEAVTTYNLFQQGYLDSLSIAAGNAQIVPASQGLTQDMKARGMTLNKNVELNIDYLAFNMTDPTFGGYTPEKRKLRQAISLAINSQEYIDVIAQGMGQPAQWIVPPGLAGYDPVYKNPYRQFDPKLEKAKRLLAEAGYPDGVDAKTGDRLVLTYDNYATTATARQIVRLYQKQIQRLGIDVRLNSSEYATFNSRINKRQVQFFNFGWLADYPDAENFAFLLYGPNAAPGPNGCLYDNPEYNKLFEKMRGMKDGPEREAIIARMRDVSVEDCPWIYVDYPESRSLIQPWVKNSNYSPLANDATKYVDLDPAMRVRLQGEWNQAKLWPILVLLGVGVAAVLPAVAVVRNRRGRRVRKENA